MVINLRMIPRLITLPEKQIKPKNNKKHPSPSMLLSIPPPSHISTVSINLLSFLVVSKLQLAFPSPWNSSLLVLLFQYACFSITYFSLFFIFPSLYQAAFTLLSCKKNNTSVLCIPQYTIPFLSVHLSVLDTSSQGDKNHSPPLPSQICTQFLCQQNLSVSLNIFSFYFMS